MSRLASLEVDAVSEFIRNGKPCSTAETVKSMAEYYAKDATLIATQMPTVRGRPAIERFWQQACEGAKAAGITRTVHREEAGSEGDLGYIRGAVVLTKGEDQTPITARSLTSRSGKGTSTAHGACPSTSPVLSLNPGWLRFVPCLQMGNEGAQADHALTKPRLGVRGREIVDQRLAATGRRCAAG
jgi:ketosteroid isomerase-like protein